VTESSRHRRSTECTLLYIAAVAPQIYTLSLHDALPISPRPGRPRSAARSRRGPAPAARGADAASAPAAGAGPLTSAFASARLVGDRKSTRLNSSHVSISYAVFCLKKQNHSGVAPAEPPP